MKKFIALLLAFTMLFSVAVPAFAGVADGVAETSAYDLIGSIFNPIIGFFRSIINFFKNLFNPPEQVAYYTITYLDTDGSVIGKDRFAVGATITPPEIPVKKGYVFMDWYPSIPETMPERDITVTAQWAEVV